MAGTGFVVSAYAFHFFGFGLTGCGCGSNPTQSASSAYFTIIITDKGYNGSVIHSLPWPIMNVTLGQTVTIHLVNCDPTQPHGFAIDHYHPVGLTLKPGVCNDVTFTADQMGTFRVYCTIFCTIHFPWMQNGRLNVNP